MPTHVIFYAALLPVGFLALSFILSGYEQIPMRHAFTVGAFGFGLSAALLLCYLPALTVGSVAWVASVAAIAYLLYATVSVCFVADGDTIRDFDTQ